VADGPRPLPLSTSPSLPNPMPDIARMVNAWGATMNVKWGYVRNPQTSEKSPHSLFSCVQRVAPSPGGPQSQPRYLSRLVGTKHGKNDFLSSLVSRSLVSRSLSPMPTSGALESAPSRAHRVAAMEQRLRRKRRTTSLCFLVTSCSIASPKSARGQQGKRRETLASDAHFKFCFRT
jgi:hypothetical protein